MASTPESLADSLASSIACLQPGTRLPSEHELAATWGTTRAMVRRALAILERQYLIRRLQGNGTFVHKRIDYLISSDQLPSLHATVEEQGSTARTFSLGHTTTHDPEVAAALELPADTSVHLMTRLGYIDDVPSVYLEEYLDPDLDQVSVPGMHIIESLAEVALAAGWQPRRTWCRMTVDQPPYAARDRLDLRPEQQTWLVESLTIEAGSGRPLWFSRVWSRMDMVRIVCRLA